MKEKQEDTSFEKTTSSFGIQSPQIIIALLLFGLTAMFLACTIAFLYMRIQHGLPQLQVPVIFLYNTLLLIGCSISLQWAISSYKSDHSVHYKNALLTALILSFCFLIAQYFGWRSLFMQDIFVHSNNAASFLYLVSGLHFLHVIAGIPFLLHFYFSARKHLVEPVSVLIYFTDPTKRLRLKLITWYWHFLDALWVYLIIFFFVNSWI